MKLIFQDNHIKSFIWMFSFIVRYYTCDPISISKEWEDSLMLYRSNPSISNSSNNLWSVKVFNPTLEEQFFMLSDLPNHHKWQWTDLVTVLRFEQKLSTSSRYYPGSPRNRIIQATCFRDNALSIASACLNNIFGVKELVLYPQKLKNGESSKVKKSMRGTNKRKKLTLKDVLTVNVRT